MGCGPCVYVRFKFTLTLLGDLSSTSESQEKTYDNIGEQPLKICQCGREVCSKSVSVAKSKNHQAVCHCMLLHLSFHSHIHQSHLPAPNTHNVWKLDGSALQLPS